MNNSRIEILKDGVYVFLDLGKDKEIRYNSVINKIGKTTSREISGSNTFSIPWIYHNIQTLGLNQFNSIQLAASLNQKYEAKYYNEDTLFQVGFVIINNMDNGQININFIDEALFITEKWGATSYNELLKDSLLSTPAAYQTAISEMVNYTVDKTSVLPQLTNIAGENFPLALFPNNLNQIGDKWQQFADGTDHVPDGINPYQSRPIFNSKAFMVLACESYGYTPIFNPSVDWAEVEKTYMVTKGLEKNQYEDGGLIVNVFPEILSTAHHWRIFTGFPLDIYRSQVGMVFSGSSGISPNSLTNFPSNPLGVEIGSPGGWFSKNSIFVPRVGNGNVGTINFKANVSNAVNTDASDIVAIIYTDTSVSNGYIIEEATVDKTLDTTTSIEWVMNKTQFNTPTSPNAGQVVGLYLLVYDGNSTATGVSMNNMIVTETYSPVGLVSYDEQGQFLQDDVDLTYAASLETVSSLLKGLMQKDGILMNIDSANKQIEFFSYGAYKTKKESGDFSDWSKYLLEYSNPKFNTNYGNNYAITNNVGLASPYPGNTVKIVLGNQTSSSKYKDFSEDYNSKFKDVVSVQRIINPNTPFTEFKTSGTSLVQQEGNLGNLGQYRYASTSSSQGTLTGLPAIVNVNYSVAPDGVKEWYNLIDNSLRAKPSFLLPLKEVKNLDLRKPILVSQLGGFYIPEEIEQYVDSVSPVSVKLIKLNK